MKKSILLLAALVLAGSACSPKNEDSVQEADTTVVNSIPADSALNVVEFDSAATDSVEVK